MLFIFTNQDDYKCIFDKLTFLLDKNAEMYPGIYSSNKLLCISNN